MSAHRAPILWWRRFFGAALRAVPAAPALWRFQSSFFVHATTVRGLLTPQGSALGSCVAFIGDEVFEQGDDMVELGVQLGELAGVLGLGDAQGLDQVVLGGEFGVDRGQVAIHGGAQPGLDSEALFEGGYSVGQVVQRGHRSVRPRSSVLGGVVGDASILARRGGPVAYSGSWLAGAVARTLLTVSG